MRFFVNDLFSLEKCLTHGSLKAKIVSLIIISELNRPSDSCSGPSCSLGAGSSNRLESSLLGQTRGVPHDTERLLQRN